MSERCLVLNPKSTARDNYARCIHAEGHRGRHEDTYGRWWGSVELAEFRPTPARTQRIMRLVARTRAPHLVYGQGRWRFVLPHRCHRKVMAKAEAWCQERNA